MEVRSSEGGLLARSESGLGQWLPSGCEVGQVGLNEGFEESGADLPGIDARSAQAYNRSHRTQRDATRGAANLDESTRNADDYQREARRIQSFTGTLCSAARSLRMNPTCARGKSGFSSWATAQILRGFRPCYRRPKIYGDDLWATNVTSPVALPRP